ncbi:MAG: metallophosphoesterase family protein [Erysipelotrichaceae bacterium]|nr:metallophosphoesterase family protein [Erysipelotrichaceae bacterium]
MKILAVSDTKDSGLYDFFSKEKVDGVELILSCGDLSKDYLEFLVTMVNKPLAYVRGNHDEGFRKDPPEGCDCLEDEVLVINGIRIAGLGGSMKYKDSEEMYTEKQMKKRVGKLKKKIGRIGGLDILVTHAPLKGCGDADDLPHQGFDCIRQILDLYHPLFLIHGHMHQEYGNFERIREYGDTRIINACGKVIIDFPDEKILPEQKKKKRLFSGWF